MYIIKKGLVLQDNNVRKVRFQISKVLIKSPKRLREETNQDVEKGGNDNGAISTKIRICNKGSY